MVEVPAHRVAQARFELVRAGRQPSSRSDLRGIDGIALVMARPVGDEVDQLARAADGASGRSSSSSRQMARTTSMLLRSLSPPTL